MPRKDGSLTRSETLFLSEYAKHGDRQRAERKAGLAANGGYHVLARPEIQKRIVQEQVARLTSDALPLAVGTLVEIMGNSKAPAAARVQASKVVIDRALPSGADGATKELHEMSPEEIAASIAKLETMAIEKAKDITPPSEQEGGIFG